MKPAILGLILPILVGAAIASSTTAAVSMLATTRTRAFVCSALEHSAGIEQAHQRVALSYGRPPAELPSQPASATVTAAQAFADKLVGAWAGAFGEEITGTITFEGNGRMLVESGPFSGIGTFRADFSFSPARLDMRGDWTNGRTVATIVAFFDDDTICMENMPPGSKRPRAFGRNAVMLSRQGPPWSPGTDSRRDGTPRPTPTRRPTTTPRPTWTPRPPSTNP